jgi:hypothetical protein
MHDCGDLAELDSRAAGADPQVHPILLSVVMVLDRDCASASSVIEPVIAEVSRHVADFEIVVVDNGCREDSRDEYGRMLAPGGLPNVQVFQLIRSVDFEVAAWAGIENSLGDFVLVFDPFNEDLSFLPRALKAASEGYEFVAVRNVAPRRASFGERLFAPLFRALFRSLAGVDLASDAAQCRLFSKRIVSFLLQQPKPALKYRARPAIAGFSRLTLTYSGARSARSAMRLSSKVRRGLNLLFAQTIAPLRLASALAVGGALLNGLYSLYVVLIAILKKDVAEGWTTLSLQQSGMFFLISLVLFVLVEYVGQMFTWNLEGPPYYLAGELTSAELRRRQKLNIEHGETGAWRSGDPG